MFILLIKTAVLCANFKVQYQLKIVQINIISTKNNAFNGTISTEISTLKETIAAYCQTGNIVTILKENSII